MKPFDLQAAMRGDPIVTRSGKRGKVIAHVPEAAYGYRVVAFLQGEISPTLHYEDGIYLKQKAQEHDLDLFMAPPPMRSINGHEFPEPVREPLKNGQGYWMVVPTSHIGVSYGIWDGKECEIRWLDRGLIQLTEEGARQQLKAMLAAVGGTA